MISHDQWENEINWNAVKDSLKCLSQDSGMEEEEARGVLVGIVSAFEAVTYDVGDRRRFVLNKIIELIPNDFRLGCIPLNWMNLDVPLTMNLGNVVTFSKLMESLPEDQRELVDSKALDYYLWEIGNLQRYWDSCKTMEREVYFYSFQKCGSQHIANFGVNDLSKKREGKWNWHGRDTSQWVYAGGMLVQDGRVSLHH